MLDELRELLSKTVYEPFRIRLISGDHYDIADASLFVIYADGSHCFYASTDGHWVIFAADRIVSLESLLAGEF